MPGLALGRNVIYKVAKAGVAEARTTLIGRRAAVYYLLYRIEYGKYLMDSWVCGGKIDRGDLLVCCGLGEGEDEGEDEGVGGR